MSFYAWGPKAPRGFGRVVGYTAGLGGPTLPGVALPPPGPGSGSGVARTASMDVAYAVANTRVIVRAPGSPAPVSPTTMATQVATTAPTLGPQFSPMDSVIRQVARAGERVADMSMQAGTDTTRAGSSSQNDPILPAATPPSGGGLAPDGTPMVPTDAFLPGSRRIPWLALGLGVVGGAALVAIFGR